MPRLRKTHTTFLDDSDRTQYEIKLRPRVRVECDAEPGLFEDKGNVKWFAVAANKVRGSSRKHSRYVYFKLEREGTKNLRHAVNATKRYVLQVDKKFGNSRREDDKQRTNQHLTDPRAGVIRQTQVCCDADDTWDNHNNEYYVCHRLVYAMLDAAEEFVLAGRTQIDDVIVLPVNQCSLRPDRKRKRAVEDPRRPETTPSEPARAAKRRYALRVAP